MSKYDFIKNGNTLYWNDPNNGESSGAYKVISVPEEIDEDSIILIASDHSEAEVFPSELSPFGMVMVSVSAILSCRPFFILIFLPCIKMNHYGFSRKSIWKNLETFP